MKLFHQKRAALLLSAALILGLTAGCAPKTPTPTPTPSQTAAPSQTIPPADRTQVNLGVIKGPSGIGAAYLLDQNERGSTASDYHVTIAADNEEIKNGLINGTLDLAAVASNVAAVLYNKTQGEVQTIAVSGLGVLYLLENGESVKSFADLKGQTIYATGQGANPEYVLNYLLKENGVDPADVTIAWKTGEEVSALMASGEAKIALLPVPAATAVLAKNPQVRQALDFSAEWDALKNGSKLTMTTLVVRKAFAAEHPQVVAEFLAEYGASVDHMNDKDGQALTGPESPAELVVKYGFAPNAKIAAAAIPQCNLVCITGTDNVRNAIQGYYEVLYSANPKSLGGSIPDDGFYYG